MANYHYVCIDKNGKQKKGTMEAASKEKVIQNLKAEDKIPLKVVEQNLFTKDINLTIGNPVKSRHLGMFCRQFHSIIAAGITIIHALEMLRNGTENKVLKKAIKDTKTAIEKGETLTSAMKEQGNVFPTMLINMVEAGEASGSLELSLERMATQFEKDAKLKAMLSKALIYPAFIGIISFVVIALMLIVVVPNFMGMFADIDVKMPAITMAVVHISNFMVNYWYIVLSFCILMIILLRMFKESNQGKEFYSRLGLKMPIFGSLILKTSSARIGKTLGTLIAAGIPLIEAIDITAKNMDNMVVRNVLFKAKEDVARGIPLSEPLQTSGVFPPMLYYMLRIGEETGNLEAMLDKVASYYEEEVENTTQVILALMEPLIIVILALIVSVILMAIFQPLITMYDGFSSL